MVVVGKTTHYNKNDDKSEQTEISIDSDKKKTRYLQTFLSYHFMILRRTPIYTM